MKKRIISRKKEGRSFLRAFSLSLLAIFMIGAGVFLTIETVSLGGVVDNLEDEEARLINENQLLTEELVRKSSLSNIENLSYEFGFKKPDNIVYITPSEVVAKLP